MNQRDRLRILIKGLPKKWLHFPNDLTTELNFYVNFLRDCIIVRYSRISPISVGRTIRGAMLVMKYKDCSFPMAIYNYTFYEKRGESRRYIKSLRMRRKHDK